MNQYAELALGFSTSRTRDFMRLAQKLDGLPQVKAAVADGSLGYTKAREIVNVATPATEGRWLKAAEAPRRELVRQVKRAKRAARVDPAQVELLPDTPPVVAPRELPVRFALDLTPEQEARRAALIEKLHKLGGAPTDRAELLLEALAALVESKGPRGPSAGPPVQIHVHEHADGTMTIPADTGDRAVNRAEAARFRCDAEIHRTGERAKKTISPRARRLTLARDGHRCQGSGCGRTRFLEIHHITPRSAGGSHDTRNLITLCGACHRLWHERGYLPAEGLDPDNDATLSKGS